MYSNARVPFAPISMNQNSYQNQFVQQQGFNNNNFSGSTIPPPNNFLPNTIPAPMVQNNFFQNNNENSSIVSNLSKSKEELNYTSFENLQNFPSNVNLGQIVEQIGLSFSDKKNWRSQFDAIQNLRVFNKFYPTEVNGMFEQFGMSVVQAIEGVRPCTVKSAIMLLREVFVSARTTQINDTVIFKFVPVLHLKALNTQQIINGEAQIALSELCTSCTQMDSVYQISCQLCFDKNNDICDNSLQLLANLIQSGGENFMKLEPNTLQGLMKTLTKLLDAQRQMMKNWAIQICQFIGNLIGEENYMNLIQNVLNQEECILMINTLQEQGKKESKTKLSFKDYRLRRQTEMEHNQSHMSNINNQVGLGYNTGVVNFSPSTPTNTPIYYENQHPTSNNFIQNQIAPGVGFGMVNNGFGGGYN